MIATAIPTSIAAAFALGLAVRYLGLPSLVGFLAAGFALNLGGVEGGPLLADIAHFGVLLLLFSVGLKVRLKNVLRPEVWGVAVLHLVISIALLAPALRVLLGLPWNAAILLAIALGFSSTVVAAKVLEAKRELRAFHGRVAIGILVVQDLVAVGVLTAGGGHSPSPWALGLLALPLLRPFLGWLLTVSGHDELVVLLGVLLAVVVGGPVFEAAGLSGELGALVMGAMLAEHRRAHELSNALWGLKEVFLVGFFLSIGMQGLPGWDALAIGLVLALLLPVKAALFFWLLTRFGLRARSGFLSGLALASYSEFGLIVAKLAADQGVLPAEWVVTLAVTVAISFVAAAPVNRAAHSLYDRAQRRLERLESARRHPDDAPIALGSAEILILGMGRVGTGAYDFLKSRDERVVGMDSDPAKVESHIAAGRRVAYADAEDPGFWQRIRLEGVRAVLLAVPDLEAKLIAARRLRQVGFRGLISATNVYPEEAEEILSSGCTTTFNYFEQAGVGFAEHTWEALHRHDE